MPPRQITFSQNLCYKSLALLRDIFVCRKGPSSNKLGVTFSHARLYGEIVRVPLDHWNKAQILLSRPMMLAELFLLAAYDIGSRYVVLFLSRLIQLSMINKFNSAVTNNPF